MIIYVIIFNGNPLKAFSTKESAYDYIKSKAHLRYEENIRVEPIELYV